MSYDAKTEMLARFFLTDVSSWPKFAVDEKEVAELAQVIQDAIDSWLTARRQNDT